MTSVDEQASSREEMSKEAGSSSHTGRRHLFTSHDGAHTIAKESGMHLQVPSPHKRQRNLSPGAIPGHPPLIMTNMPTIMPSHDTVHTMTLFYAGAVLVYDNVPPPNAHAIMLLAKGNENPTNSVLNLDGYQLNFGKEDLLISNKFGAPRPAFSMFTKDNPDEILIQSHTELPVARKISLARFLEKRKERIQAKASVRDGEAKAI